MSYDDDFEPLEPGSDFDPELGPDGLPASGVGSLAPIWARGIARILDLFIILMMSSLVLNVTGVVEVVDEEVRSSSPVLAVVLLLGVWGIYEVAGTSRGGRMVGKLVMGVRVRQTEADLPPTPMKAMSRFLLPAIALLLPLGQLVLIVLMFIYLSALTHPDRQGFHDRMAHTIVVRAR